MENNKSADNSVVNVKTSRIARPGRRISISFGAGATARRAPSGGIAHVSPSRAAACREPKLRGHVAHYLLCPSPLPKGGAFLPARLVRRGHHKREPAPESAQNKGFTAWTLDPV